MLTYYVLSFTLKIAFKSPIHSHSFTDTPNLTLFLETNVYKIPVFVRRNQGFRLPRRTQTPIIMVGPGTGIAPFRGFIQERAAIIRDGRECGANVLFFGCRHEEELKMYESEGVLQLYTAFSRDSVSY